MRRTYLTPALTILLVCLLIITGLHWDEVWAMLSSLGSQLLSACLNIALVIGGITLILKPIHHK